MYVLALSFSGILGHSPKNTLHQLMREERFHDSGPTFLQFSKVGGGGGGGGVWEEEREGEERNKFT